MSAMKRMRAVESDGVKLARKAKDKLHKACETSEYRARTLHRQEQNNAHGKHKSRDSTQVQSHALMRPGFGTSVPFIPAATVRRILALTPSEPTALLSVEARLNVRKTYLLPTSRKRRAQELEQVKLKVNTQELVGCEKVKCLGVVLDDGLM